MKKMNKKKQITLICILSFFLLLAGTYLFGLIFFQSHFMPRTYINNIEVSMMNKESAEELTSMIPSKVYIIERNSDGVKAYKEMIDLTNEASAVLTHDLEPLLASQDTSLWFLSLFEPQQLESVNVYGEYNKDQYLKLLDDLYCFKEENIVYPADSHIEYLDHRLQIVEGGDGSYIKKETAIEKILQDTDAFVKGSGRNVIDLRSLYEKAEKQTGNVNLDEKMSTLQKILDKTITINVDASTSFSLQDDELGDLLILKDNEFTYDDVKLEEYSRKVADQYNVSDEEYIDRSALKASLREVLLDSEDTTIDVDWVYSTADYDEKLIEVSYSKQKLYYYENGELVFSCDVVTGNDDFAPESEAIPAGTYHVQYKKRGATLSGADYTEYVEYWIGFGSESYYDGGHVIGFHDASWRNEFGGNIWQNDPSHGCINMPTDMVARLYELADIGTPINIYY
ncbi:MAG: L,D-transpeptidase [Erysipelotrichaceae bacterium]|nr:L,D-transpeptidase [Erysipelotrichaceae bacterium]